MNSDKRIAEAAARVETAEKALTLAESAAREAARVTRQEALAAPVGSWASPAAIAAKGAALAAAEAARAEAERARAALGAARAVIHNDMCPHCGETERIHITARSLLCNRCGREQDVDETDELRNAHDDLLAALSGLCEHCVMVHKHWGEHCNAKESQAAIDAALAAIAKAKG